MKILLGINLSICFLISGCVGKQENQEVSASPGAIIIEGNIKNLPEGWIWLTPANRWKVHLDSANVKDGHFSLRISKSQDEDPMKVSLRYADESKPGGIATVRFMNGEDDRSFAKELLMDAFYIEHGRISIDGDLNSSVPPKIRAGQETGIMFMYKPFDFGWIDLPDPVKRKARMELLKDIIRRNPDSYYLLESVFQFKDQYSKEEFEGMFSLFDGNVKRFRLADSIQLYLSRRPNSGQPYASTDLYNKYGSLEKFPDNLQQVNMIIFWASWCTPCRREIPALKQLYQQYKNADLQMVSVSIDQDNREWKNALEAESMPWKQLRCGNDQVETLMQRYNFKDIPLTVFVDSAGQEIKRFSGYDPDSYKPRFFLEEMFPGKK